MLEKALEGLSLERRNGHGDEARLRRVWWSVVVASDGSRRCERMKSASLNLDKWMMPLEGWWKLVEDGGLVWLYGVPDGEQADLG